MWRWQKDLAAGGVAALIPDRKGPQRPSRLTPQKVAEIRELDGQGMRKAAIAAAAGVSETSVRNVLRAARAAQAAPHDQAPAAGEPADEPPTEAEQAPAEEPGGALPVLPDLVPRDGEWALARFGLLGEGAAPAFTPGARYPLAGLLLALPALADTGPLQCARQVYGRLRGGFYHLDTVLVHLVLQALLREPRAEGATRVPPPRGPGAGLLGTGSQDGPPQDRRSRRRRQGRGPADGDRPAPRRRPPRAAGVHVHRRAHPGATSARGTCRRCTSPG